MWSKNNISPKDQINQAGNDFKEAWKLIRSWTKNTINAWNNKIGSKIPDSKYKIINKAKNNLLTILLVSWITFWWVKAIQKINNPTEDKNHIEIYQKLTNTDKEFLVYENLEKNIFWNNEIYFDKEYLEKFLKVETIEKLNDSTIIKRDAGLIFYLVTPEDIKESRTETINYIIEKLWSNKEFEYLKEDWYKPTSNSVTNTFNIRPDFKDLWKNSTLDKNPFWIPIPIKKELRQIESQNFLECANKSIDLLWDYNESYDKIRQEVLKEYTKDDIATLLTSIALIETWQTTWTIGDDTYHRREEWDYKCFSFWPQHVLMKYAWLQARFNLWLTEGQVCHPINSNMLVLWFIIEKFKERWISEENIIKEIKSMLKFLKNDNLKPDNQSLKEFCIFYNWSGYKSNKYNEKLVTTIKISNIPDQYRRNKQWFTFENIDSSWENIVYSYTTSNNTNSEKIKKTYNENYNHQNGIKITDKSWKEYSNNEKIDSSTKVYIKVEISKLK